MLETAIFDHYEILTRDDGSLFELGRGGMGITYKAFDTSLRFPVALKVINATYLRNELARQRFVREARSAAKLRNRHVASVFHLAMKGDTWFYAMEFIDGETVGALIKRHGPLSPALALNVTAQVARALNAAAHHGLVHRDIKPDNVMLVEDDDELIAKVIDFGLAKAAVASDGDGGANLSMGGFVGTAHFASPEQWEEREIDSRSDIYSLGVTLWYMLTGQPPFFGSMPQVMRQHLAKSPPFERLEGLPAPVADLLRKMLAKDPAERFQTPGELRKAVEVVLETILDSTEPLAPYAEAVAPQDDCATLIPQEAASFETNTTIADRYQVAQSCGETNAGRLFRAYDTKRKSEVRLLVLHRQALDHSIALGAIEREVEKLAAVQHPNLLGVFGFETVERGSFLVLEWTEGFSLLELLKARRELNADEALKLLNQAAEGADHAISLGLSGLNFGLHHIQIHFLQPIEKEKLLRAPLSAWPGFTVKLYPLGSTRDLAGSQTWAGEKTMLEGADISTVAADARTEYIQALAVVAYEVLGGTISPLALRGPGGAAARYTPLSTLSEEGNDVLRRALDPARSFPSAREFTAALGKLDGPQVRRHEAKLPASAPSKGAPSPPPPSPMIPRAKRSPSVFVRVFAVVIVVSIGIAVFVNSFDDETNDTSGSGRKPGAVVPDSTANENPGAVTSVPAPQLTEPESALVRRAIPVEKTPVTPSTEPESVLVRRAIPVEKTPATPSAEPPSELVRRAIPIEKAPAAPPAEAAQRDPLNAAIDGARELEGKGDWSKSLDAWLRVARDYPESPRGKESLERLLNQLRDRSNPMTAEEFQGMREPITQAGQMGIPSAMRLLGDNLRREEPKEAYVWYSKAAKGDPAAEASLGFMLGNGDGVQRDLGKAFEHFKSAADKGNISAKFGLGECYRHGYGIGKDVRRAARLLHEAADAGDPRAMSVLGDCYVHGEGVKINMGEAFKFYSKAKEHGDLNATGNLGVLYLNGQGVAADPKKAAEIFAGGAEAGDSFCMLVYAECLQFGKGVDRDPHKAIEMYRKAALAGNEKAVDWCIKNSVNFSPGH